MENWEMSWRQLYHHWRHRRCWQNDNSTVGNPRCRQWHKVGIMMIQGLATPNAISDDRVGLMTAPGFQCVISTFANVAAAQAITDTHFSLGYLLIYPPQIATVMKFISFCSKYNPVSHTKSLGESQEWNMFIQGNIWSRVKAFKKIMDFLILATEGIFCT